MHSALNKIKHEQTNKNLTDKAQKKRYVLTINKRI